MTVNPKLNWLALAILIAATLFNQLWVWGLLFVWWSYHSLRLGQVFLLGNVTRHDHPGLFWAISILWFLGGAWYLATPFLY